MLPSRIIRYILPIRFQSQLGQPDTSAAWIQINLCRHRCDCFVCMQRFSTCLLLWGVIIVLSVFRDAYVICLLLWAPVGSYLICIVLFLNNLSHTVFLFLRLLVVVIGRLHVVHFHGASAEQALE